MSRLLPSPSSATSTSGKPVWTVCPRTQRALLVRHSGHTHAPTPTSRHPWRGPTWPGTATHPHWLPGPRGPEQVPWARGEGVSLGLGAARETGVNGKCLLPPQQGQEAQSHGGGGGPLPPGRPQGCGGARAPWPSERQRGFDGPARHWGCGLGHRGAGLPCPGWGLWARDQFCRLG